MNELINNFMPSTCPTGCESFLPAPPDITCLRASTALITDIFIGNPGYPFTDITDADEWATRISPSPTPPANALRHIRVFRAQKPAITPTTAPTNWGSRVTFEADRTLTFVDQDSSKETHDWHRLMNCPKDVLFWYKTADGKVFGGNSGILGAWSSSFGINDVTDGPTQTWAVTIGWRAIAEEPMDLAVY